MRRITFNSEERKLYSKLVVFDVEFVEIFGISRIIRDSLHDSVVEYSIGIKVFGQEFVVSKEMKMPTGEDEYMSIRESFSKILQNKILGIEQQSNNGYTYESKTCCF